MVIMETVIQPSPTKATMMISYLTLTLTLTYVNIPASETAHAPGPRNQMWFYSIFIETLRKCVTLISHLAQKVH